MALNLNLNSPSGWNKWLYPKTTEFGTQLPDASFPYLYSPANAFWLRSIINHCLVPWINVLDPLSAFMLGGGNTGSILGSIGGLAVLETLYPIFTATGSFSLVGNAAGPIFGYCIGNSFKQHAYIRFDVQNAFGNIILMDSVVEYLENSRFKRVYVNHGEIVNYRIINGRHVLSLDITKTESPPKEAMDKIRSRPGTSKINIIQQSGKNIVLNILELLDNWDIVVSAPEEGEVPATGDFYRLNKIWCIEDPYLISGFWEGREDDIASSSPASGLNLFLTRHNKPYEEGKVLGVYIWEKDSSTATDSTADVTTDSTTTPIEIFQPSYSDSMNDSNGYSWSFLGFGNARFSDTYTSDTRYNEVYLDSPDEDGAIVEIVARPTATYQEYNRLISNTSTDHIRIDISKGAYIERHNWYSPCLTGCYFSSVGKLYKILSHVEANIIDVSLISIDGKDKLDIYRNQDYSIINQSAWMITENYFQSAGSTADITGIFDGTIESTSVISGNIHVRVRCKPIQKIMTILKGGISLLERYTSTYALTDMEEMYPNKYEKYKMIAGNSQYGIDSISLISIGAGTNINPQFGVPFDIDITLKNYESTPPINVNAYVSLDVPYPTYPPYTPKSGFSISLKAAGGLTSSGKLGFTVSNTICLDGEFFSAPYLTAISANTRIGITEGYLFGMEINGSAQSRAGAVTLITTPRAFRGVASLFHALRQEDWAIFQDPVTKKITIRRGSLDFLDYPMKDMVVIGKEKVSEPIPSGTSLVLDGDYDWLRKIQFDVMQIDDIKAIIFGVGNIKNIYGNYVSGDGLLDLEALRKQGITAGKLSSSTYQGDGYSVSPAYSYVKNYYQNQRKAILDIGVKTEDGPLIPKPLAATLPNITSEQIADLPAVYLSGVKAQYVKDNQTLEDVGLFDIIRLPHGESILIYSQKMSSFTVNNITNNDSNSGTKWQNQNAVVIIGTYDDDFTWAKPLVDRIDDSSDVNQYALMIMNSVDFLSSIYNQRNNTLSIFSLCYHNDVPYIGCLTISLFGLIENNFFCTPIDSKNRAFSWRAPCLKDDFINNQDAFWTDKRNVIGDGFSFGVSNPENKSSATDMFVRVMGSGSTQSQIAYNREFGIISTSILPDGGYILFYDSEPGVKAIYSNDSGYQWRSCELIYARNARGGVIIGERFFYITADGIMVKQTHFNNFETGVSLSAKKDAGNTISSAEIEVQESLDSLETTLIGSGAINYQRISGYVTHTGVTKVFFYDLNNLLKCIESNDGLKWSVSNNF